MTALNAEATTRFRARRLPSVSGAIPVVLALIVLVTMVLAALLAPVIAPFDPNAVDLSAMLVDPGVAGHPLGTDSTGRDTFSRLLYGGRQSLVAPLLITVLSTVIGSLIGVACGWMGGVVDSVLSRVVDFLFAFPSLLLAMLVVAMFGPGLAAPTIGLTIAYTPYTARLVRNLVLQERSRPYVEAYRLQGFAGAAIASRKILPNISPILLAQSALGFGYALVDLAALSYLGLGVQPPTADWGVMVADGQDALIQDVIWPVLFPCLAIVLVVVSINIVGDYIGEKLTGGALS